MQNYDSEDASPLFCTYSYRKISLLLRELLIMRDIQEGIPRITVDRPILSNRSIRKEKTNNFSQTVEYFSCVNLRIRGPR